MKKICPHCKEEIEYEKHQQFGGHITSCNKNSNRKEIIEKGAIARKKERKTYIISCALCDNKYEVNLTETQYKNGKYNKCCSEHCAKKLSSSFVEYNRIKNSKCIKCGCDIKIKINASEKNSKCDECGDYKNKKNIRQIKVKKGIIKNKKIIDGKIICSICGQEKCRNICKIWISGRAKIFIKFGFNIDKIGTIDFYEEYQRIVDLLKTEYENNSLTEIAKKYEIKYRTLQVIFKNLKLKVRNLSESVCLAYQKGKCGAKTVIYPYKSGYHMSWEGKKFWYRSSYELDYCKELDKNRIKYEMETLRIQYFDTQKNKIRIAIPDFYLIDNKEIVEIKSSWTYDEQNMKDKTVAYKKNGYNVKIILEGKEIEMLV